MRLNQVLALEMGVKPRAKKEMTRLYHLFQKAPLFFGLTRVFTPRTDDDENLPSENNPLQANARDVLKEYRRCLSELIDVVSIKDFGNCEAFADVVVDDKVLLSAVPAVHILWLEKTVGELITVISAAPVLTADADWEYDEAMEQHKAPPVSSARTKKKMVPIVLYPATTEHPAQTQLVSEDVVMGHWTTTRFSSALAPVEKRELLDRANKLLDALRVAREKANSTDVTPVRVGSAVTDFLFG